MVSGKKKMEQQSESERLQIVQAIVTEAIKAGTKDVVKLTADLLDVFCIDDRARVLVSPCPGPVPGFDSVSIREVVNPELEPKGVLLKTIKAPFPEGAISGEPYDMLAAIQELPSVDELPTEWQPEFSVIRTDEQTVVMNSVHYSDLISLRDRLDELKELRPTIDAIKFMENANARFLIRIHLVDESTYSDAGSCSQIFESIRNLSCDMESGRSDQWHADQKAKTEPTSNPI